MQALLDLPVHANYSRNQSSLALYPQKAAPLLPALLQCIEEFFKSFQSQYYVPTGLTECSCSLLRWNNYLLRNDEVYVLLQDVYLLQFRLHH